MSFKFEHQAKKYWAKQTRDQTEVYLTNDNHMPSQIVMVIDGKADLEQVKQSLINKET